MGCPTRPSSVRVCQFRHLRETVKTSPLEPGNVATDEESISIPDGSSLVRAKDINLIREDSSGRNTEELFPGNSLPLPAGQSTHS